MKMHVLDLVLKLFWLVPGSFNIRCFFWLRPYVHTSRHVRLRVSNWEFEGTIKVKVSSGSFPAQRVSLLLNYRVFYLKNFQTKAVVSEDVQAS